MDISQAREILSRAIEGDKRIDRAFDNTFVRADEKDYNEATMLQALEELLREGRIVQIPSAGQCRTSISYRRADATEATFSAGIHGPE